MLDEAHKKSRREATWKGSKAGGAETPYGTYDGMTIFEAARAADRRDEVAVGYEPTDEQWRSPNFYEDAATGSRDLRASHNLAPAMLPEHATWFFYMQRLCNHCTYPACLAACPRGAIYKRPEDGIVLIDQSRCRGYRKCVAQCGGKQGLVLGDQGAGHGGVSKGKTMLAMVPPALAALVARAAAGP